MFDITSERSNILLNKMVDFTALKQKVIANNISNVNTPGYKRQDVSFDKDLNEAINNGTEVNELGLNVVKSEDKGMNAAFRKDGNTVNIDSEVSEMMQNALSYNIYVQLMSTKYGLLKQAMSGGGN